MARKDGKRYHSSDMMYAIAPHIMAKRSDGCNSITVHIPYEPMHEYIVKKRAEGIRLSHMALIIAAYARTASQHPAINRFVVNKNIYSRNELIVAMVVQRSVDAQSTMGKLSFELTDTIFEINDKINKFVDDNRQEDSNETDALMHKLTKFSFLLRPAVCLLKWMDKHGLLPRAVIDASPFHCSMVISNLASIRTNHIFHHIYDFGTTTLLMAMGVTREVPVRKHGEIEFVRSIPIGIVMDERICNGCQYALAFKRLEHYLKNPQLLETPPETILEDIP